MTQAHKDVSKMLSPLLHAAFRQGVAAATRGDDQNPYVPNSHLYHAWIAGWATLSCRWSAADTFATESVDCACSL